MTLFYILIGGIILAEIRFRIRCVLKTIAIIDEVVLPMNKDWIETLPPDWDWTPTMRHILQNEKGFNASDFERASEAARQRGLNQLADFLVDKAAERGAEHLIVWGHLG